MKRLGLLSAALALASGPATAQPATPNAQNHVPVVTNPDWERKPTGADMAHYWPEAAKKLGLRDGNVVIRCQVNADGNLSQCIVESESPAGADFGISGLALAQVMRMKPKLVDGTPVGGAQVTIPIHFHSPLIIEQSVVHQPSYDELRPYWPAAASRAGIERGQAVIHCQVMPNGKLAACDVNSEFPTNLGFGKAALDAAPLVEMTPHSVDGKPDDNGQAFVLLVFNKTRPQEAAITATPPFPKSNVAGQAKATEPEWVRKPTETETAAYWPSEATAKGLKSGQASLACRVSISGSLTNCSVASESPRDSGFGKAALALSKLMLMKPRKLGDVPQDGAPVNIPVAFSKPTEPPLSVVRSITNPEWLRKPTIDELSSAWPLEASNRGLDHGRAVITCVVTVRGALDSCVVASEEPKDAGFGPAAIVLAPLMLMKPKTEDGQPVGGARVSIPIAFTNPGFGTTRGVPKGMTGYQIRTPIWATAPDSDVFAKQFPTAAKGKAATGHVVLTCHPAKDGSLKRCETRQETPQGLDFGKAAFALSTMFRANMAGLEDKVGTLSVDVPFFFIDPASAEWQGRAITKPIWIAAPGPEEVTAAFPKKAHDAKETKGIGRVSCMVGPGGHLIDCHAAGEAPAGLGFADASLTLAPKFAMNPWSAEGLPVDGVRLTLPVQLVDGFDAPVADAGPTTPPSPPTKP